MAFLLEIVMHTQVHNICVIHILTVFMVNGGLTSPASSFTQSTLLKNGWLRRSLARISLIFGYLRRSCKNIQKQLSSMVQWPELCNSTFRTLKKIAILFCWLQMVFTYYVPYEVLEIHIEILWESWTMVADEVCIHLS